MTKDELQQTAAAKSDQIDADNLIGGITMDVTIKAVQRGPSNEQPLQLVLEETDKFYRPSKTYRRALIGCFGDEPANWIGQRLRLIRNPNTMFGGVKVGGIEVSHASIKAPVVFMLSAKRGKKSEISIDVIPEKKKEAPKRNTVPLPQEAPTVPAANTVSGDPSEGDLSGVVPPVDPNAPADKIIIGNIVNAFASKLNMTVPQIEEALANWMEAAQVKPMDDWTNKDVDEAREMFKKMSADAAKPKGVTL